MNTQNSFSLFLVRVVSVAFWCVIIGLFLQAPTLYKKFFAPKRSINVFTWPLIFDPHKVKDFEHETGIKVFINYYENNEELYSKIKATGGAGYDLIVPSHYLIEQLIAHKLIKKIDTSQLNFFPRIKKQFLSRDHDPRNEYSVPYFAGVYGIGYDKKYFADEQVPKTWGLVFDQAYIDNAFSMTNDPRAAVLAAAYYLFGSLEKSDTPEKREAIKQLLQQQKKQVQMYTEERADDLLMSRSCQFVVTVSYDIWKASREYPYMGFMVPNEGSFLVVESFVVPALSEKDALVYEFLNFMYRDDVITHNVQRYGFCPVVPVEAEYHQREFCDTAMNRKDLAYLRPIMSSEQLNELWLAVMAD